MVIMGKKEDSGLNKTASKGSSKWASAEKRVLAQSGGDQIENSPFASFYIGTPQTTGDNI
jgi:hypothetical protein